MALRRPVWMIVLTSLVTVLGGVGFLAWWRWRTGPRVERLAQEAYLLEKEFERPSHVQPATPGSFARALEPLRGELMRAHARGRWYDAQEEDPCLPGAGEKAEEAAEQEVASEEDEDTAQPVDCEVLLEDGRGLMRQVLDATHSERGGLPGNFREPGWGWTFFIMVAPISGPADISPELLYVARLADLELRRLQAAGQWAEAVDTCLDVLALGRDVALGSGMRGRDLSVQMQERVYRPCAEVLAAAPVERLRRAVEPLNRLNQGWPALDDTFHIESVARQLLSFGNLMSASELALLPPVAQSLASGTGFRWEPDVSSQIMAREKWKRTVDWFEAMEAVAKLPASVRPLAFARVDADFQGGGTTPPGLSRPYVKLAEDTERQALQLEALRTLVRVRLARADTGQWPQALPEPGSELFTLTVQEGHVTLTPRAGAWVDQALQVQVDAP